MKQHFPELKKNFGFGMMRLPMNGDKVDMQTTAKMVDAFLEAGFQYFDTAHPYLQGQSEEAVKLCLAQRYPRETFLLANKLSETFFRNGDEVRALIRTQLDACGVEYFDFFLMHALSAKRHAKFMETGAYDIAQELKAQGKLRHVGFSFHDSPEVLEQILTDRPEMEFVQLQFNYVDYDDLKVQSRACYEVCCKHNKPVMVMEPVKGGSLVQLPAQAMEWMENKPASYAIRYAAGFENVVMVLSGMSTPEQMEDNLSFMKDFTPLTEEEQKTVARVRTLYQSQNRIPCTACRYCTDGCPVQIPIPEIFAAVNGARAAEDPVPMDPGLIQRAADCVACGQCEKACPQHLQIPELLKEIKQF